MRRIWITLEDDLYNLLTGEALPEGVSEADLVRRYARLSLPPPPADEGADRTQSES